MRYFKVQSFFYFSHKPSYGLDQPLLVPLSGLPCPSTCWSRSHGNTLLITALYSSHIIVPPPGFKSSPFLPLSLRAPYFSSRTHGMTSVKHLLTLNACSLDCFFLTGSFCWYPDWFLFMALPSWSWHDVSETSSEPERLLHDVSDRSCESEVVCATVVTCLLNPDTTSVTCLLSQDARCTTHWKRLVQANKRTDGLTQRYNN